MKGCICNTNKRWLFFHLTYCPWRRAVERDEREGTKSIEL